MEYEVFVFYMLKAFTDSCFSYIIIDINLEVSVKKRGTIITVFLSAILAICCLVSGAAHAEEPEVKPPVWLQISPTHKTIELDPGAEYDDEFVVTNIGSEDFDFKVYASPFSVVGEEYNHNYESETKYNQISRWVSFDETEYSLAVGESQTVKYHINVPADVAGGSQHAVLFAESSGKNNAPSEGIKAVSRVGIRLAALIHGETRFGAEITEYKTSSLYMSFGGSKITTAAKVKNTGNTDFEARFYLKITPFFSNEAVHVDNKAQLVYPESELKHESVWDNTPLLGLFNIQYTVSASNVVRDEKFVVLVIPIWFVLIVIMLLTFIIVWIIMRVKKRRQLRSKIQF